MPSTDSTPSPGAAASAPAMTSAAMSAGTPPAAGASAQPVHFADDSARLAHLTRICASAGFNRWAGFEVVRASAEEVLLAMPWRDEAGQYSGFLHAGLIGALLDTVSGFAASAHTGQRVMASHFAVNCLAPAAGRHFVARGRVVKAGRKQIFARAELHAHDSDANAGDGSGRGPGKLVATGEVIFVPVSGA